MPAAMAGVDTQCLAQTYAGAQMSNEDHSCELIIIWGLFAYGRGRYYFSWLTIVTAPTAFAISSKWFKCSWVTYALVEQKFVTMTYFFENG